MRTALDSGLSRVPWHTSQVWSIRYFLQFLFVQLRGGFFILAIQDGQHPFVLTVVALVIAVAGVGLDVDFLFAAVEHDMLLLGGELVPAGLNFKAKGLADAVEQGEVVGVVFLRPGGDGGVDRQAGVGHHQVGGKGAQAAQPVAVGAGPVGGVKGEQAGGQLFHHRAVLGAGKVFRKYQLLGQLP
jgi:hypothetical protein